MKLPLLFLLFAMSATSDYSIRARTVPPKAQLLLVKSLIWSYSKRLTFLSKYYLSILYVFEWTPISWTRYRKPLVASIISTPSTPLEMKGRNLVTQIKTLDFSACLFIKTWIFYSFILNSPCKYLIYHYFRLYSACFS